MECMKKFERILKGLANHRRLTIVKFLQKTKEANVSEIAGVIDLSLKATSKHLNILANLDILERQQKSLEMFYRLMHPMHLLAKNVITYISNSRE